MSLKQWPMISTEILGSCPPIISAGAANVIEDLPSDIVTTLLPLGNTRMIQYEAGLKTSSFESIFVSQHVGQALRLIP